MAHNYLFVESDALSLQIAGLPDALRAAVFSFSLLSALGLAVFMLYRRNPSAFRALFSRLQNMVFPGRERHEARLERVICTYCNKGMGVYDPIYVTHQGDHYIEGTCACCGHYIRARLN